MNPIAFEDKLIIYKCEEVFEWRKWIQEIPFIKFPSSWEDQIIPPFAGAIARFRIRKAPHDKDYISVYLDGYNMLGIWYEKDKPAPYWEVYPIGGDTYRCDMLETDKLLSAIKQGLREIKKILEEKTNDNAN